jgi:hypothetical protein
MGSIGRGDALMLWATLITLLILSLGGDGDTDWFLMMGDLAPDVLEDGERLDRAEQAANDLKVANAEFEENIRMHRAEVVALDADYHATAEDYRRALGTIDREWRAWQRKIVAIRFEFRDQFTREEWDELILKLDEKLKPQ